MAIFEFSPIMKQHDLDSETLKLASNSKASTGQWGRFESLIGGWSPVPRRVIIPAILEICWIHASEEQIVLDDAHVPGEDAKDAFDEKVAESIKESIKKSRRSWKIHHESSMWARAAGLSDDELTSFSRDDLVQIRNGQASYGHVIFGKLRLPAVNDKLGEGYVHVRIHHEGVSGWKLHAIHHLTASFDEDGHPHSWRAIHPDSYPLEFFEYHSELHEAPQRSSHR
ncbi:uncharacterized protein F5891DRAFT_1191286 [Suillus fuscotomentosus]|uniref:Uncharacterized protein n=1 Tax=Suillus fuscotomentosus TaxID=1912939 RepID=A0AAD4E2C8_9AGAM|nr:uncharacterized protein F5891DRAFT_1191286 [Suillus fuscotomentosus]KAG1897976.1 hypothetical protein F5891DRAFT_1191286 [Suillus fuscotomentosus]